MAIFCDRCLIDRKITQIDAVIQVGDALVAEGDLSLCAECFDALSAEINARIAKFVQHPKGLTASDLVRNAVEYARSALTPKMDE